MANIAEIVRGAVNSIPTAQWESAESLAFTRLQTLWRIILPQCVKRMIPPWMNWYAILTMATPLISIVGVNDAMTLTQDALAVRAAHRSADADVRVAAVFFFIYCYPIARWTIRLERKYRRPHLKGSPCRDRVNLDAGPADRRRQGRAQVVRRQSRC